MEKPTNYSQTFFKTSKIVSMASLGLQPALLFNFQTTISLSFPMLSSCAGARFILALQTLLKHFNHYLTFKSHHIVIETIPKKQMPWESFFSAVKIFAFFAIFLKSGFK